MNKEKDKNKSFFLKNGYLIIENVFNSETIEFLINQAKILKNNNIDFSPLMNPHKDSITFLEIMSNKRIIEFIEEYFDNKVMGLQTEFFFMPPNTKGFTPHQDNTYVEADEKSFISAWIALTDVDESNGGLIIWPESHNEKKLDTYENEKLHIVNQDKNARSRTAIIPEKYKPHTPKLVKGSVLMIDSWIVHASNDNCSDSFRYALLCTYIKKDANFRSGNTAKRKSFNLLINNYEN